MEQSLQVRRITGRDAAGYYALRVRSIDGSLLPAEPEVVRELSAGAGQITKLLHCYGIEGTRIWGVFDTGTLAGAVGLSRHFPRQHLDTAYLWGLFVHARYRGTAVSRLLMDAVVAWCEHEIPIEWIATRFARGNVSARQYFERFGFEASAPFGDDDVAVWRLQDLIHMQRRV